MNDRFAYNMAFYDGKNKELLLNIVRLRYNHPPVVLNVNNISGSTKLEGRGGVIGRFLLPLEGSDARAEANGSIAYSDNPIISYTPMVSKSFNTQYLSPLSLRHLYYLLHSTWSISRVFRVSLQQAGSALNASTAARSISSYPPNYVHFDEMVSILRRLQLEDAFIISYQENKKGQEELILNLKNNIRFTAKERQILRQSGIKIYNQKIIFANYIAPHKTLISTRSVFGILNYLSKGMDVPPEEVKSGVLDMTYKRNGEYFNWHTVLHGIMKIHYCAKKPEHAFVTIPYANRWYYIDERDNDSKKTFILLVQIIGLITMEPEVTNPVGLTRNV